MATRIGLEPTTPSVTGWCSNQLSYRAMIAQVRGVLTAGTLTIIPEKPCVVKQYFQKKTNYFARVVLFRLTRAGVCQSKCPEGGARLPQAVGRGDGMPLTCVAKLPERPPAKQNARSSQKSSRRYGRGSKFRTHGTRFWRPLLYQLSYTPMWSCYPDSNWRPHPYQGCALPTEL